MSEKIQAIRGMNDVLPNTSYALRFLERSFADCALTYGYREFRAPLLENTALFKRSIGEVTDIVEKEMYTFPDRNGESLTLRPEGTAGCVRACLEHGLLRHGPQKLWYAGPMFRYEKPQKGRYRQFQQLGLEAFGLAGVGVELEMLALCARFWRMIGVSHVVQLQINTIGTVEERERYKAILVDYFKQNINHLDDDSVRRLEHNPLRILDSKNPEMKAIISNAPQLIHHLGDASQHYFSSLCSGLDALNIEYEVNPCLVRGLDYYEHTVFEWVTSELGSQGTVCAGGRFDRLVEHLGGAATPAVGFAMGAERLLLLMQQLQVPELIEPSIMAYLMVEDDALPAAIKLAEAIRETMPDWIIVLHTNGGRFKNQFKKADKSGARLALILGEDELNQKTISIKDLRCQRAQQCVPQADVVQAMKTYLLD
ncbi:MAG: histidine--tRNA ligase [Legionellaceae bacterium]|nr:histidine--tRNA ligase [Legionellaceae bacterium]